jgi:hypothetical protein
MRSAIMERVSATASSLNVSLEYRSSSNSIDVKLSKARRLRFVHDLPLQGKSAHILNFRAPGTGAIELSGSRVAGSVVA